MPRKTSSVRRGWSSYRSFDYGRFTITIQQYYDGVSNISRYSVSVFLVNRLLYRKVVSAHRFNDIMKSNTMEVKYDSYALRMAKELGQAFCDGYDYRRKKIAK